MFSRDLLENIPNFLSLETIYLTHNLLIQQHGGSLGVRDEGLLLSALATPEQMAFGQWLHEDLAAMAAAYLFHLAKNHPFVDGNKRIGLAAALIFLDNNGFDVSANVDELEKITLKVASSEMRKDELTVFFRTCMTPLVME